MLGLEAKAIAGAVALLALLSFAWVVNGWRDDAEKLPAALRAESKAISDLTEYKVAAAAETRRADAASQVYLDELATLRPLRDRPLVPAVVRVCDGPGRPRNLPTATPVPGGSNGAAAPAGGLLTASGGADPSPSREVDLGPELDRLRSVAIVADTVSARLRSLQGLVR